MKDIFELLKGIKPPREPSPAGAVEWLIVGLGNPGEKYGGTRHNIGFEAIERLSQSLGIRVDRIKFKSLCGDCTLGGKHVLLMKPGTFMNLSGQAVQEAAAFYKLPMERVIVISDDVSLDVGRMRIRGKGSDGGHNGLKNIIYLNGSDAFVRIRIGVGKKPHPDYDLADWVLGRFDQNEQKLLSPLLDSIRPACELIIQGELQQAMSRFNTRQPPEGQ